MHSPVLQVGDVYEMRSSGLVYKAVGMARVNGSMTSPVYNYIIRSRNPRKRQKWQKIWMRYILTPSIHICCSPEILRAPGASRRAVFQERYHARRIGHDGLR